VRINLAAGRSRQIGIQLAALIAVVVALVGAAAGNAGNGTGQPDMSVTIASAPAASGATNCPADLTTCATVPYSTDAQPTFVRYTITIKNNSRSTFTNVILKDPVTCTTTSTGSESCTLNDSWGGTIVDQSGCTPAPSLPASSVTCSNLGTLQAGDSAVVVLVAQMPQAPTGCSPCLSLLENRAAASGDERFKDKPASHVDTKSAVNDLALTADTTDALASATRFNTQSTFQTNPNLSSVNTESTQAVIPAAATSALVSLRERAIKASECQTAGLKKCLPQVSEINDELSPYTDCVGAGCLQMTFTVLASSLPSGFQLSKFQVFHITPSGTEIVPQCPAVSSLSGDCLSGAPFFDGSGNLVYTAAGPANGGWGGG
jgi:uncharacterized repeat protein (TIGR01451 family)